MTTATLKSYLRLKKIINKNDEPCVLDGDLLFKLNLSMYLQSKKSSDRWRMPVEVFRENLFVIHENLILF